MKKEKKQKARTIHFVALGCPKNRVDTEVLAGIAEYEHLEITADPHDADVIVVNTCAFIASAKEESVETILEMAAYKDKGRCTTLVAAGCLTQRYKEDLKLEIPEIDHIIGTTELNDLGSILEGRPLDRLIGGAGHFLQSKTTPRVIPKGTVSAYIKIGDGCSRQCAFCAIPAIRGKAKSRSISDIVAEANRLIGRGVKELNLVSQDTSAYGRDLDDGTNLPGLLEALDTISGTFWVRLLYLYPDSIDNQLLEAMRDSKRCVPYLDVPIQHASANMLRRMRRGHGPSALKDLVARARKILPDVHLRTTVLVGHPGETADDFNDLMKFVEQTGFDHLGAFRYSDEEGTPSFDTTPQVSGKDSYNRWRKLMSSQRKISKKRNKTRIGAQIQVLVEDIADDAGYVLQGRHRGQAPEVDGVTYLVSSNAKRGDLVDARVIKSDDFDLIAEPLKLS